MKLEITRLSDIFKWPTVTFLNNKKVDDNRKLVCISNYFLDRLLKRMNLHLE